MKMLISFGLLLFMPFSSWSQSDFKHGFIRKPGGDTIYGAILTRNFNSLFSSCQFKPDGQSEILTYYPTDILAYRISNERFMVSKAIHLDGENKKVFLEYLINGIADLYCYSDRNKSIFYIQQENDSLLELKNTKVELQGDYVR